MTTHDGLIPARAGTTEGYVTAPSPSWAHPRSRGEHHFSVSFRCRFGGSSPLARGTLLSVFNRVREKGLIPARAGNTRRLRRLRGWTGAHPRSRGEHCYWSHRMDDPEGSSPLARGTHPRGRNSLGGSGLIPARAGNTCGSTSGYRTARAHPRSRGEHRPLAIGALPLLGSSPLARGTRIMHKGGTSKSGLIPARAGNTTSSSSIP